MQEREISAIHGCSKGKFLLSMDAAKGSFFLSMDASKGSF